MPKTRNQGSDPIVWLHESVPAPQMTPDNENIFFGFHDVSPWPPTGGELLGLRLPRSAQSMADTAQEAAICLWDTATGSLRDIGSTTCWNFQQAARMQWLPDGSGRAAFNRIDSNGECGAELVDPSTGQSRVSGGGIYAISSDGAWGISPDFGILAERWPAYGYASLSKNPVARDPAGFGLWHNDLVTGERSLFVSLSQVLQSWSETDTGAGHFLTHPSISPDGSKVVFLHRFFAEDEGSFTRLLVCDANGSNLIALAEEKVSHFDWLDNQTLLVWARFAGGGLAKMRSSGALNSPFIRPVVNLARQFTGRWKKRVLSESYFSLKVDGSGQKAKFGWPDLDLDGHPMVARQHDWIVTDTYPDAKGELTLLLWNQTTQQRVDVARIRDGVTSQDSDAKCDLHPRWNRDETKIAVDCCHQGLRRIAVFDVSSIVRPEL